MVKRRRVKVVEIKCFIIRQEVVSRAGGAGVVRLLRTGFSVSFLRLMSVVPAPTAARVLWGLRCPAVRLLENRAVGMEMNAAVGTLVSSLVLIE